MGHKSRKNNFAALSRKAVIAALLTTTTIATSAAIMSKGAYAQTKAQKKFDIPAGPLNRALAEYGNQSGTQISYEASITGVKTSPGFSGMATKEQALAQTLKDSGLSYHFADGQSVLITQTVSAATGLASADGSLLLDTITVNYRRNNVSTDVPYETAAPTDFISAETIERFRGSSPADIFRGTPGVMSGEARNGAGAIDVNIRGMQGMGRVAVTIDGATNATNVYQGYQGISNRTFVDPDFLSGIDITRGSDIASSGIAGSVAMRTVEASDIIKDGQNYGLRLKGGFGTNSSTSHFGDKAGYAFPTNPRAAPITTSNDEGLDRPSFLEPTNGSGSAIAAMKYENLEFLAGYAQRKRGNYYAGSKGPFANPVNVGPRSLPDLFGGSQLWPEYLENAGIANYRAGEEVLNTELETKSYLIKSTINFAENHDLQIGYNGFRSEAGDGLASTLSGPRVQDSQREFTSGAKVDTGTLRYRWNPEDNDLLNLKANLWISDLELRNPRRNFVSSVAIKELLKTLPRDFRTGTDSRMWGADISNTSILPDYFSDTSLTYGLSFLNEDTRPSLHSKLLDHWLAPRDGERQEAAAFMKASWKANDWITLNGGLRYQHFWSKDRTEIENVNPSSIPYYIEGYRQNDGGFSPSVGVTVEPFEGSQLYANYSNAMRMPSIMEATSSYGMAVNTGVNPERASNWEIGTNLLRNSVFTNGDLAMFKLGYFNSNVKDYISRSWLNYDPSNPGRAGLLIANIHSARFSGFEFSSRYETRGFTAELSANYYVNVEFCRAADTCNNASLYGDYATNQVPPKYSLDLTLSQRFMEDALTVGGRASYTGARAIGHGDAIAQGAQQFITLIDWKPYTLVDVFTEYDISEALKASFRVDNVFDRFYVDPLSLTQKPGPGRTFYASLTASF